MGAAADARFAVNSVAVFARALAPPRGAFFPFGPRGTGKSTWIRARLPDAHVVNFRPEYRSGIRSLESGFRARLRSWIGYRGDEELVVDGTRVVPVDTFLWRLHAREILG